MICLKIEKKKNKLTEQKWILRIGKNFFQISADW